MSAEPRLRYRFASFCLDPGQRTLLQSDAPIAITPKVFDLLLVLVENAGRLVTKQELLARVWPDTFVEEANLSVHVSVLRKFSGTRRSRPSEEWVSLRRAGCGGAGRSPLQPE